MTGSCRFGLEMKLVVRVGRNDQGNTPIDRRAMLGQVRDLAWIVGDQPQSFSLYQLLHTDNRLASENWIHRQLERGGGVQLSRDADVGQVEIANKCSRCGNTQAGLWQG